jgi:murein L,D-transpeptidase YafK
MLLSRIPIKLFLIQIIKIQTRFLLPRIRKGLSPVLLFLVLMICHGLSADCTAEQTIEKQGLVPSNLLKWGRYGAEYVVLVDKSQQKVMLYRSNNLLEPVKVYQCSTGENDGRKSVVNDKKTPEGIYYFINSFSGDSLSPIYGSMALPLNYPNIFDIREGRNGYGIWFHGLNKPLKPNDTSGCIALENKDIEDLASYITLFDTPVIISSSIEMATEQELEEKTKDITAIIEGWRDSWQNKDIDKYMSFYSRSFKSGNKNWNQVKDYKTRVTKKYNEIAVAVDDLGILMNNNVVIASFKQTYRTPAFESSGTKKLYITKNSEEWKIIGETFSLGEIKQATEPSPGPENLQTAAIDKEQIAPAAQQPAPQQGEYFDTKSASIGPLNEDLNKAADGVKQVELNVPQPEAQQEATAETKDSLTAPQPEDFLAEIEEFINSWIDAWEVKDTDRYISFYDEQFISRGMDLDAWKSHRARLNKRYASVIVEISDLKITKISDEQAEVSFIQNYRADGYTDHGEKNMVLIKKGNEWKIKKEEWKAISG